MATYSQRSLFLGFLLSTIVSYSYATGGNYEVGSNQLLNNAYRFEFVPLLAAGGHSHVKRQASNSNNLSNTKTKLSDGKFAQKLDKNSASVPSDTPSPSTSVKKNLSQSLDESKSEFDDDLISELTNNTAVEKPTVVHDHHKYYNSTIVTEPSRIQEFWIELDQMDQEKVVTHEMLSKSYRRAATVTLSFDFPFYGHILRNATIATGGFLYLGDYMHSWLASTQYIAPLMANFDTSLRETSVIKYADNGTHFIVQWIETVLKDYISAGTFTFQVCLGNTGDIIFAYKDVPVAISEIPDSEHPVRVGVSDAYIIDRTFILHKKKIIYEYHRVELRKEHIANLTAVYLTALPSCISLKDCESCLRYKFELQCTWCEQAQRCSDGMDRHRHDWLIRGCDSAIQVPEDMTCPQPATLNPNLNESKLVQPEGGGNYSFGPETTPILLTTPDIPLVSTNISTFDATTSAPLKTDKTPLIKLVTTVAPEYRAANIRSHYFKGKKAFGTAGIIGIFFVVALVVGFVSWMFYAYRYPHTPSGQIIIKYRPSQWHWLKGEADYTPASVHI